MSAYSYWSARSRQGFTFDDLDGRDKVRISMDAIHEINNLGLAGELCLRLNPDCLWILFCILW